MHTLLHKTLLTCLTKTVPKSASLVVAVSGGCDSIALGHALQAVWASSQLHIAHLDHQLRAESSQDAQFVAETAEQWQVAYTIGRIDVKAIAQAESVSLETAARLARYRFLAQVAERSGTRFIVTAHHANDQAETILHHLARGAGLRGLSGMTAVSPLPVPVKTNQADQALTVLRPWLTIERTTIEQYCEAHALTYRTDPSNADTAFTRNRIRHDILPRLSAINPQIAHALTQLAEVVRGDETLLAELAQQAADTVLLAQDTGWVEADTAEFRTLPISLRRRLLRHWVAELAPPPHEINFRTIEQADGVIATGEPSATSTLPGGVILQMGYGVFSLRHPDHPAPVSDAPQLATAEVIVLPIPSEIKLVNGWSIKTSWLDRPANMQAMIAANQENWQAFLQPTSEQMPLFLRPRQAGERLQPLGMNGQHKSLKKLMIDHKTPAALRPLWPVVATAEHVGWLVGHSIDRRLRVIDQERPILHLVCQKTEPKK